MQRTRETTTKDLIALYHSHFWPQHNKTVRPCVCLPKSRRNDPVACAPRARRGPELGRDQVEHLQSDRVPQTRQSFSQSGVWHLGQPMTSFLGDGRRTLTTPRLRLARQRPEPEGVAVSPSFAITLLVLRALPTPHASRFEYIRFFKKKLGRKNEKFIRPILALRASIPDRTVVRCAGESSITCPRPYSNTRFYATPGAPMRQQMNEVPLWVEFPA